MSEPIRIAVRKRTSNQVTAAQPDASVWVSANAGTGKTGVLVDRISRLLLSGVAPERILCLTFTKAAAAEMANRLSDLLSQWSAMDDHHLREELSALGETAVDDDMLRNARRLFAATLDAPEGLRIRTIHSFCESLLGRFPLEARVSPDFRVMDERDQRELQREARDRMLAAGDGRGTGLADALREMAKLVDETRFAELMRELDTVRGDFRAALKRHDGVDGLIDAVFQHLNVPLDMTHDSVLRSACSLSTEAEADLRRLADAWSHGSATNVSASEKLSAWLDLEPEHRALEWQEGFQDLFLTKAGAVKADRTLMSKGALAHDDGSLDIAHAGATLCLEVIETIRRLNTAHASRALIHVGAALTDAYEGIKTRRGRLDYDDLIERASWLLASPGGVSWVHYKLDGGIEHVLVDEAQDTSPDQWRVIEEVASDFFSGAGRYEEDAPRPRTMFAVGDEKQSIYSFQGADPAMFGTIRERFAERVTAIEQTWRPVEMAESFRSAPAILRVVDKVFETDDAIRGLSFDGHPVRHVSARTGQSGEVILWSKEEPHDEDRGEEPWDAPLDRISTESPEDRVATRIADTIDCWLKDGAELPAQGRAIRPGDVLILVQKRRRFAELMVAKLKDRNIPVSGRDRMILPDQLAIQDLIALGRLALLPEDDLNTGVVLKGPFLGLDEEELFDLAHDRSGTLMAALTAKAQDNQRYREIAETITAWRQRADFQPPFEFYSQILNAENGRCALLGNLGPEAGDPIDDFLSAALDFERDHVPSLEGFLHWMETGAAEIKRDLEQGRNEVRVMTVHGAKGLQSEIVFIADACTVPSAQADRQVHWLGDGSVPLWSGFADNETDDIRTAKAQARETALEEYRRLLYVAMTRAKDRLIVAGFTGRRPANVVSWYDMVDAALGDFETRSEDSDLAFRESQTAAPDGRLPETVSAGLKSTTLPTWSMRPPAPEPSPPRPLSPSRPDDEEPPVHQPLVADDLSRFKRGRLIHALLQTLPDLPADRRRGAAASYLAQGAHGLATDAQSALLDETMAILEAPELEQAFGPHSLAETPIVGTVATVDGQRVIAGQIDRLVIGTDIVTVIDYKTNRPPPADPADVAPAYLRQMAMYRAALTAVHPGKRIRAVLLWTDGPRWMELPDQLLNAYAP